MSQLPGETPATESPESTGVDENMFTALFGDERLGDETERAHRVYVAYGANLQGDVINVLLHASDKDKVVPVLERLEEHLGSHLQYQHPEIRGLVHDGLGVNETTVFFVDICETTLGLTPN